jgi:pimeloyl-ACP methyl ester carboxylesterase
MAHSMAYRRILPALQEHYRVLLVDLPGHGKDLSFRTSGADIGAMTQWMDSLLKHLQDERGSFDIISHSLSALLLSLSRTEFDGKLVLASPGIRLPRLPFVPRLIGRVPQGVHKLIADPRALRMYEPLQWRGERMTDDEARAYLRPLSDVDRRDFMLRTGADLLRQPNRISDVTVREQTLILWGTRDHMLPLRDAFALRKAMPGSRVAVVENAGHAIMEDAPDLFLEHVLEFLDSP